MRQAVRVLFGIAILTYNGIELGFALVAGKIETLTPHSQAWVFASANPVEFGIDVTVRLAFQIAVIMGAIVFWRRGAAT